MGELQHMGVQLSLIINLIFWLSHNKKYMAVQPSLQKRLKIDNWERWLKDHHFNYLPIWIKISGEGVETDRVK
ncbi:hypothetical protein [Photobacterium phosphoreum]|uniref:hypothetical protein n=1 Tax=Photobacterium phosphoreum TaxID=659 RepID=UPI0007F9778E|nr:hypothetical protein [Photobacterium phosphoreum]MCD9478387.1 hypothetical protein [Photobacterium phosphoreum]OBU40205.1 hypothetical protein AYY26_07805 [Photobacterium phosphoreum]PSU39277.1 hypothetical protein CTM85_06570 [Photobacterium phosphoreum]